jgi:FixJ family two-component response regulator
VKKPPTVFIVDDRPAITNLFETTLKEQFFWVECYPSAAQFIADQQLNHVGCVLVDLLSATQGDVVLSWLHKSKSPLSIVLISGFTGSPNSGQKTNESFPTALKPHEISALLTMVTDGLAGSLTRQVIRERSGS